MRQKRHTDIAQTCLPALGFRHERVREKLQPGLDLGFRDYRTVRRGSTGRQHLGIAGMFLRKIRQETGEDLSTVRVASPVAND